MSVIAPVPYAPAIRQVPRWYAQSRIGRKEKIDGIKVLHPRFLVLPKMPFFSGLSYFLAVVPLLRQLQRQHGSCLIHAHCAYPDGVGVALAARLLRLPYVITVHGSDLNVYAAHWALRPQISRALAGADGVIAVSRDLEAKVLRLTGGTAGPLACIPCAGFDPAIFFRRPAAQALEALGFSGESRLAVFVGNLVPVKGVDILVKAWVALKRRALIGDGDRLVIIGGGICHAELEREAGAAGIAASVRFTGAIPQAEVSRWIAAATLLCLPSHSEGMPNVVVEALASGVPVVATRVGGIPELVADGENGLLVPPGRPEELADALVAAFSRGWDRERIRASVAQLTWQELGARNIAFLDPIAARRSRSL